MELGDGGGSSKRASPDSSRSDADGGDSATAAAAAAGAAVGAEAGAKRAKVNSKIEGGCARDGQSSFTEREGCKHHR